MKEQKSLKTKKTSSEESLFYVAKSYLYLYDTVTKLTDTICFCEEFGLVSSLIDILTSYFSNN